MIKEKFRKNIFNIRGWKTSRKIIVIESDDWGSIRSRSKEDLNYLQSQGMAIDKCHYMQNDSLASEKDLTRLFEVLSSIRDSNRDYPVITANCLVANPDFDRIKKSGFSEYHFQKFTDSLSTYPKHKNSFGLWKEGIENKVFFPQLHGREHLNISRWMTDLQSGNRETRMGFDMNMFGLSGHIAEQKRGSYLAALDGGKRELKFDRSEIISDASGMFTDIFGYSSKSFIAPNYVWDDTIEKVLFHNGIKYLQGSWAQLVSKDFNEKRSIVRHYMGESNKNSQLYLTRNCSFEPSENHHKDWVDTCLNDINIAFRWRKPAIISSHRVNYIGFINPENSDRNLKKLDELLTRIMRRWPEAEFISSVQLGEMIETDA